MARTTTNIHGVVGISVERVKFSDFVSTQFTFHMGDGSTVEVGAFSAEMIPLTDYGTRGEIVAKADAEAA